MYLPKIVNSVLVNEVKSFIKSFKYKWTLLKGKVTCIVTGSCKWIEMNWNNSVQFSLDFFTPVKASEILAPIIGAIYAKYPEYMKPIQELLKEWDKYPIPKGFIEEFKNQINNHLFEISYANGELTISQSIPDTENICKFRIDNELLAEILKLAAEDKGDKEPLQDFVFSILPANIQEIVIKALKEEYEEISEYRVHEELDKKFEDSNKVEIDYDLDTEDDALIVRINNEKKYRFIIKSKDKCIIEVNGKEFAVCHNMTTVKEFIESM